MYQIASINLVVQIFSKNQILIHLFKKNSEEQGRLEDKSWLQPSPREQCFDCIPCCSGTYTQKLPARYLSFIPHSLDNGARARTRRKEPEASFPPPRQHCRLFSKERAEKCLFRKQSATLQSSSFTSSFLPRVISEVACSLLVISQLCCKVFFLSVPTYQA